MLDIPVRPVSHRHHPAEQALHLLRWGFALALMFGGTDKFTNMLTDWTAYLAPVVDRVVPGTAAAAMMAVGAVEMAAAAIVLIRPRLGGYLVAGWLAGVIAHLLLLPGFYDVALRDGGLLLAALALARLAVVYDDAAAGTFARSGVRRG